MRILGLMSGTSLDGVDAAILETDGDTIHAIGPTYAAPFSAEERALLKTATAQCVATDSAEPDLLSTADKVIVDAHVRCAKALLAAPDAGKVTVIGYHGQTVLHRPERQLTVQIGSPGKLAQALGIDVIADLRQADIAAGGEGAPLVPVYHAALARRIGIAGPVAFLNVGGVANLTFIGRDGALIARDTGPGNGMLDLLIQQRGLGQYDADGAIAARGKVNHAIVAQWLAHPYFQREGPKSLDRHDFPLHAVAALPVEDAAATLVAFTAQAVAISARTLPEPPTSWIICGGGRHHPVLMRALREALGDCKNADDLGLRGDFIEAEAMAFIAARSLRGLPVTFPGTTGVNSGRVVSGVECVQQSKPELHPHRPQAFLDDNAKGVGITRQIVLVNPSLWPT